MKRLTLILPRLPWLVVLRKWHLGKAPMLPKPGMAVCACNQFFRQLNKRQSAQYGQWNCTEQKQADRLPVNLGKSEPSA